MNDIKVWAQMFFDDGSVSQGIRIPAEVYDDDREIQSIASKLLKDTHRSEGFLLIWGAGDIRYGSFCVISSLPDISQEESDSSASES